MSELSSTSKLRFADDTKLSGVADIMERRDAIQRKLNRLERQRISSNGQIFYLSSNFFFPASWVKDREQSSFFCCILLSYAVITILHLQWQLLVPSSMAGGLRYSFLTLRGNSKTAQPEDEENVLPESKY